MIIFKRLINFVSKDIQLHLFDIDCFPLDSVFRIYCFVFRLGDKEPRSLFCIHYDKTHIVIDLFWLRIYMRYF